MTIGKSRKSLNGNLFLVTEDAQPFEIRGKREEGVDKVVVDPWGTVDPEQFELGCISKCTLEHRRSDPRPRKIQKLQLRTGSKKTRQSLEGQTDDRLIIPSGIIRLCDPKSPKFISRNDFACEIDRTKKWPRNAEGGTCRFGSVPEERGVFVDFDGIEMREKEDRRQIPRSGGVERVLLGGDARGDVPKFESAQGWRTALEEGVEIRHLDVRELEGAEKGEGGVSRVGECSICR